MEREALHAAAVQFSLDLHPSATGDVMEGVRDQLNSSLLRHEFIHTFPTFMLMSQLTAFSSNLRLARYWEDCWKSQKHADHRIARDTALRFRVEKIDDESEFFTMAGSLLATGTGSIPFISQQAKAKSKKRRRSEAAATDAPPSEAPAAANTTSTPTDSASDGASAKARRKAAKQLRKAAASGSARAAALVEAIPEQAPAATAPDSTRWPDDREVAGGTTDPVSPKKKKRRKHHDQPTEAPASNVTHSQLPGNVQSHSKQTGSATANGSAALLPRAVANSPVVEGPPVEPPATAPSVQNLPKSQTGVPQAKQKSHKKKKREIDKLGMPSTTPSGHSDDVRKEQTQSGRSVDADANGDIKKKKRKQHKITGV